jgi:methylated-DNA-protein-cysteine methyltransferase related protein
MPKNESSLSPFSASVQAAVNAIPPGYVASYGQIALLIGMPRAAQAVGQTLHLLGDSSAWFRVVNRQGRLVTKCGHHTFLEQKALLEAEGIQIEEIEGNFYVNMKRFQWINNDDDLLAFLVQTNKILNKRVALI